MVVDTDNSDGRLLPYLTANLQFELEQHTDVFQVPNAALRGSREAAASAPARRATSRESSRKGNGKERPSASETSDERETRQARQGRYETRPHLGRTEEARPARST